MGKGCAKSDRGTGQQLEWRPKPAKAEEALLLRSSGRRSIASGRSTARQRKTTAIQPTGRALTSQTNPPLNSPAGRDILPTEDARINVGCMNERRNQGGRKRSRYCITP